MIEGKNYNVAGVQPIVIDGLRKLPRQISRSYAVKGDVFIDASQHS